MREKAGLKTEGLDVGEVAIVVVVIESVADDEMIFDGEAEVIRRDFDLRACRFPEQDRCFQAGGLECGELSEELLQCLAGVEDVVNEQDIAPGEWGEIFEIRAECARGGAGAGVTGSLQHADLMRHAKLFHQVGQKEEAASHDAEQRERAFVIIGGNGGGQFLHSLGDLCFRDEGFHVGSSHRRNLCGREAGGKEGEENFQRVINRCRC